MLARLRLAAACLVMTAPSWGAFAEDKLSRLDGVEVETEAEQVVVSIQGTRAPNFTSFTMQDPFRVVVDWAGSRLPEEGAKRTYDRGLVREVDTKQFNSEAEKISRVIVKLSQSTTYRVEAKGTTVRLVLDAVPDPLPAPAPEPVVAAVVDQTPEESNPLLVQEGPLTEPDVAIPTEVPVPKPAPVVIAKAPVPAPAPSAPTITTPAPSPSPEVTPPQSKAVVAERAAVPVVDEAPAVPDVDAPAPVVMAKAEPAAAPAPTPTPAPPAEPEVMPEPVVAAAPTPAAEAPAPAEPTPTPVVVAEAPAPAPAPAPVVPPVPEPEPVPVAKAEPVRLATFTPPAPEAEAPQPAAKVSTPKFAKTKKPEAKTQRLAAAMPKTKSSSDWSPPAVHYERRRSLKVVKVADPQDTLQPEGSTPADEIDVREARPAPTMPTSPDANDFDPGPRVMKYIGFRQMAGTSRIFVRMDGKARYRQSQEGDLLVIELMNTSVPVKNNTRALDTSYFNSPVLRVQAVPRGENTRVEVRLREQGSFQVKRIGTTIAIDFSRAP